MTIQPGHITDTKNIINCKTCYNKEGIIDTKKGNFIIKKSMMLKGIAEDSELIKRAKE